MKPGLLGDGRYLLPVVSLILVTGVSTRAEVLPRTVQAGTTATLVISGMTISPGATVEYASLGGRKVRVKDVVFEAESAKFTLAIPPSVEPGEVEVTVKDKSGSRTAGYFVIQDPAGEEVLLSNARSEDVKLEGDKLLFRVIVDFDCPQGARFSPRFMVSVPAGKDFRLGDLTADNLRMESVDEQLHRGTLRIRVELSKVKVTRGQGVPFLIQVGVNNPTPNTLIPVTRAARGVVLIP